jgi:hypothetical protein
VQVALFVAPLLVLASLFVGPGAAESLLRRRGADGAPRGTTEELGGAVEFPEDFEDADRDGDDRISL